MTKKITLILILICLTASCGKKGDPKYKDSKKNSEIQNILISKS